jgi:hypothetical protein
MRIAVLTNEYPPHVYGGAGVHVEYLTRELARLDGGAHTAEVCRRLRPYRRPRPVGRTREASVDPRTP